MHSVLLWLLAGDDVLRPDLGVPGNFLRSSPQV